MFLFENFKMKIDLYNASGKKDGSIDLNKTLFGAKINKDLMHRAVLLRLANRRNPIAHTKTRGEITCSTRKIFRQKGTGNARRGAKSTSMLRGGGVTHGPRNTRNFTKMMPKKERRAALFSALSAQAADKKIFALKELGLKTPKTKDFLKVLENLPQGKRYLFVLSEKNEVMSKSMRNIKGVDIILANYLNPYDVLQADQLCFFEPALVKIESVFLNQN